MGNEDTMLIFGHVGVSLALVNGLEGLISKRVKLKKGIIDYRVVAFGALLPDIIDKPLVQIRYGLSDHDGHFIAHSPIFAAIVVMLGLIYLCIKKSGDIRLMLVGLCCFFHQFEDMLMSLQTDYKLSEFFTRHHIIPSNLGIIDKILEPLYRNIPYLTGVRMYLLEPYVLFFEVFGFVYIMYFIFKRTEFINMLVTEFLGKVEK